MDRTYENSGRNRKSVCEKIFSAISHSHATRPPQSTPQHQKTHPTASVEFSKTRSKLFRSPEPRKSYGSVPIVFDDSSSYNPPVGGQAQQGGVFGKPLAKPERLPTRQVRPERMEIQGGGGGERPKPTRVFSEYIERAGSRIRTTSSVGTKKPTVRRENLNNRVSDYIHRTKLRFTTMPSFVDRGNAE